MHTISKIPHYVIVGGGLCGLSTAYFLSLVKPLGSFRITLLEKSHRWGGLIETYKNPTTGSIYELGPHSARATSSTSKLLLRLVAHLDLSDRLLWMRHGTDTSNQFIYVHGKHVPLSLWSTNIIRPFTRSPLGMMIRKMFTIRPPLDNDISVDTFLRSRLDDEFADYFGSAMMRGIYAGDSKKLSAKACLPSFVEMETRGPNFVLGMIRSIISSGIPEKDIWAPLDDVLPNPSHLLPSKSIAWNLTTGMQTLVDRLVTKLHSLSPHVQMHLNSPVDQLQLDSNHLLTLIVDNKPVVLTDIDALFLTCPSFVSRSILKNTCSSKLVQSLNKKHIPWNSLLSINVELANTTKPPVRGFGHLIPVTEDPHVLGVIYDSMAFPQMDQCPNNQRFTIMTNLLPRWFDTDDSVEQVVQQDIDRIIDRVLEYHLKIANPHIVGRKLQLYDECIPQYRLGHLAQLDELRNQLQSEMRTIGGGTRVHLAGMSYDGVGMCDVVYSAMKSVWTECEHKLDTC